MDPNKITNIAQDRLDDIIIIVSFFTLLPLIGLVGLWNYTNVLDAAQTLTLSIQWVGISVSGILSGLLVYGYFVFAGIQKNQTKLMEQGHHPSLNLELFNIVDNRIIVDVENTGNGMANNISIVSLVDIYLRDEDGGRIKTGDDSDYFPGNSVLNRQGSVLNQTGTSLGAGKSDRFELTPIIWKNNEDDNGKRSVAVSEVTSEFDSIDGITVRFVLRYQSMSGEVMFSPGFRVSLPVRLEESYTSEFNLEEMVEEGSIDGFVSESDLEEAEEHVILGPSARMRADS
jgi:hypothetical protein